MDLGREVEVVDGLEQQAGLGDDLRRALAVAAVGRAEELAIDDLRKADDRVQRGLDLVHQLAKRVGVRQDFEWFAARGGGGRFAHRQAAISGKAPVARLERRDSADLPFARDGAVAGEAERSVAERSAHRERAQDVLVQPLALHLLRAGDRPADQCAAGSSVDPGDFAARAAFPAEQNGRPGRDRRPRPALGLPLAGAAAPLDPGDDFVERGAGGPRRFGRDPAALARLGRRFDEAWGEVRVGRRGDLGMQRLDEPAGLVIGRGQQRAPLRRFERRRGQHRRRHGQPVGGEAFKETERQRQSGDGARGRGAQRLFNIRRFGADRFQRLRDHGARAVRPSARDEVNQLPPAHRRVVAIGGRLVQHGQQAIVEPQGLFRSLKTDTASRRWRPAR